jgi:hypothetical protein
MSSLTAKRFIRLILFLIVSHIWTLIIAAQSKHDLSIQYCLVTTPDIFDASHDLINSSWDGEDITRSNVRWTGGFYGTFRYFFTDIQSIDAVFGYSRTNGDLILGGEKQGESLRDFYTLGIEWSIHYIRKEFFQMYSGGGLGVTFIFEDNSYYQSAVPSYSDSKAYPNFNFTFVGFRFGKKVASFIETGFGYNGLIAFGISAQF